MPPCFRRGACALGLVFAAGCTPGNDAALCSGVNSPAVLEVADLTPDIGAQVVNDAIVHAFSVTSDVVFNGISLSFTDAHTAGQPSAPLSFQYSEGDTSTTYTADPVVWEIAPGHVEIEAPVVYQTPEGCAYRLPSPLFSYDVTAP